VWLGTVVSRKDGSNGRLRVVECCLDVPGPPRLLMVCDQPWAGMGTRASGEEGKGLGIGAVTSTKDY